MNYELPESTVPCYFFEGAHAGWLNRHCQPLPGLAGESTTIREPSRKSLLDAPAALPKNSGVE